MVHMHPCTHIDIALTKRVLMRISFRMSQVIELREMCRRIDRDGSGDISYSEFVAELESGASGMQHLRRTLEGMFRSADLNADGVLSLWEFARVMMPRANPANLNEILAWMTYDGPAPDLTKGRPKTYSAETVAQLKGLFELYDTDSSGMLDGEELHNIVQTIMASFTGKGDRDGEVSDAVIKAREDAFLQSMDFADKNVDFATFVNILAPMFEQ